MSHVFLRQFVPLKAITAYVGPSFKKQNNTIQNKQTKTKTRTIKSKSIISREASRTVQKIVNISKVVSNHHNRLMLRTTCKKDKAKVSKTISYSSQRIISWLGMAR